MTELPIRLDRDGRFFFRGEECIRREITDLFFEKLESDGRGGYQIRLGPQVEPVAVEEAPLRVHNLHEQPGGKLLLILDGGLVEPFDAGTLRFEGDVPWCRARGLDARFTVPGALALGELYFKHGDGPVDVRS